MPLPVDGPATDALVKAYLSLTDDREDARVTQAVNATNAVVKEMRCVSLIPSTATEYPESIVMGAVMLAGRLVRRKNSPGGYEITVDAAVYVSRSDPDIGMLLAVGPYSKPHVS